MAIKYHINAKGERAQCFAEKRPCRYRPAPAPASSSHERIETKEQLFNRMDQANEAQRVAAIEPNPLLEPNSYLYSSTVQHFTFDDDVYYPEDSGGNLSTEIVEMPDEDVILRDLFKGRYPDHRVAIPADLRNYARKIGVFEPENYNVSRGWGYYDEIETDVELKPEVLSQLKDYYFNYDNAVDEGHILPFLRSKGFATKGKNPTEALTSYLESKNIAIPEHVQPTKVTQRTITAGNIISDTSAEPVAPVVDLLTRRRTREQVGAHNTLGIAVKDSQSTKYVLLEGSGEFNWVKQNTQLGRFSRNFLVLE